LIKHGSHWINFTIIIFISESNRYFKSLYKIRNKIISFDIDKKAKCKTSCEKNEKKNGFENLWSESLRFKCGTSIMLGPNYKHIYKNSRKLICNVLSYYTFKIMKTR
jgi:ABC-type transporter MlaC component